jgi:hypothetical protein
MTALATMSFTVAAVFFITAGLLWFENAVLTGGYGEQPTAETVPVPNPSGVFTPAANFLIVKPINSRPTGLLIRRSLVRAQVGEPPNQVVSPTSAFCKHGVDDAELQRETVSPV